MFLITFTKQAHYLFALPLNDKGGLPQKYYFLVKFLVLMQDYK